MNLQNPVKAIRAKCLDCCCEQQIEVKLCPCTKCSLYPFRFGKNPFRSKRILTDEQKAEIANRMKKARDAKEAVEND